MSLGNRIREMRKMQRLSQEELAYRLGTNRVSLSQWENDKVTPDTDNLTKIAMALGTGVGYLLGETDNPVLDYRQCADADAGAASACLREVGASGVVPGGVGVEEEMLLNLFRYLDKAGQAEVINFIQYKLYCLKQAKSL